MRVGAIVDLAFTAISGGIPTSEVVATMDDVRAYLPAAINAAMLEQLGLNLQMGDMEMLPTEFIASYEDIEVKVNDRRDLRYIESPVSILALPKNLGLATVSPMKGGDKYERMQNQYQDKGYEKNLRGVVRFWVEGRRIYFKNIPESVETLLLRVRGAIDEYDDDAECPIPAGLEKTVIDVMVEHFTGQRQRPEDKRANANDEKLAS